ATFLIEGCRTTTPLEPLAGTMLDDKRAIAASTVVTVQVTIETNGRAILVGAPVLVGRNGEASSALVAPRFDVAGGHDGRNLMFGLVGALVLALLCAHSCLDRVMAQKSAPLLRVHSRDWRHSHRRSGVSVSYRRCRSATPSPTCSTARSGAGSCLSSNRWSCAGTGRPQRARA